jgi:hypothetical protein
MSARKMSVHTPAKACDVARFLGVSPTMLTAAKKSGGYVFEYGSMTTPRHFLKWRAANPDFTVTAYVAAHSKTVRERIAKGHSQRRAGRRGANARNRGSQ